MRLFPKSVFLSLLLLGVIPCPQTSFAKGWETLKNCKLLANPSNDGDSFHVEQGGKEYIFRLYFVDCPEIENTYPDRVRDQGAYFKKDEKETIRLGQEAEAFTKKFLAGGTFTVYTCWEDARGASALPRQYAFVEKDSKSLIEILTGAGYVRIYGMTKLEPDNPLKIQPDAYLAKLRGLENQAKSSHVGGWGKLTGNAETAEVVQPSTTPTDPIQPQAQPVPAIPATSSPEVNTSPQPILADPQTLKSTLNIDVFAPVAPPAAPFSGTININTATAAELRQIPEIGYFTAQKIIEGRPYKTVEELNHIKEIDAEDLEKITPHIRVKD